MRAHLRVIGLKHMLPPEPVIGIESREQPPGTRPISLQIESGPGYTIGCQPVFENYLM